SPATIDRDADNPRLERSIRVPALQAAKDPQENFLSHILGVLTMAQQADAQAEDLRLKAVDQDPDRFGFPPKAATHQSGFFGCHVFESGARQKIPAKTRHGFRREPRITRITRIKNKPNFLFV